MIELFKRILASIFVDSESVSKRNGYLSWRGEWHAAAWGTGVGILTGVTGDITYITLGVGWLFTGAVDKKIPGFIPYPSQFIKESGYLIGHIPLGIVIGLTFAFGMNLV